ncbi:MAG: hypothetical protein ACTSQJ_00550 [Promethearchaeota archaeon]
MSGEEETLEELKYLLGNMGMEILLSISRGAKNFETIRLFSGIPLSCIRGRIPVLLDLNLIGKKENEYYLTEKGLIFKERAFNKK